MIRQHTCKILPTVLIILEVMRGYVQPVLMDVYSGVNSIVLDADTLREVGID